MKGIFKNLFRCSLNEHRKFLLLITSLCMVGAIFLGIYLYLLNDQHRNIIISNFAVHSSFFANYQPDEQDTTFPVIGVGIIKEMLEDTFIGEDREELSNIYDDVIDKLKTPVPSITLAADYLPHTPSPTITRTATDEESPIGTVDATKTMTKQRTSTLTALVGITATEKPAETLTPTITPLTTIMPTATPSPTVSKTSTIAPTRTSTPTELPTNTPIPTITVDSNLNITVNINNDGCDHVRVDFQITNTGTQTTAGNVQVIFTITDGAQFVDSLTQDEFYFTSIAPGSSVSTELYIELKQIWRTPAGIDNVVTIEGKITQETSWAEQNVGKKDTATLNNPGNCEIQEGD